MSNTEQETIGEILSGYDSDFLESKERKEILITEKTEQRLKTASDHIRSSRGDLITTYDGLMNFLIDEFWSKPVDFSKSDRLY